MIAKFHEIKDISNMLNMFNHLEINQLGDINIDDFSDLKYNYSNVHSNVHSDTNSSNFEDYDTLNNHPYTSLSYSEIYQVPDNEINKRRLILEKIIDDESIAISQYINISNNITPMNKYFINNNFIDNVTYRSFIYENNYNDINHNDIDHNLNNHNDIDIFVKSKENKQTKKYKRNKNKNVKYLFNKYFNKSDDDVCSIGIYTKAVRKEKIRRYKEKKNRKTKPYNYKSRQVFARKRQRVCGRFTKIIKSNI